VIIVLIIDLSYQIKGLITVNQAKIGLGKIGSEK